MYSQNYRYQDHAPPVNDTKTPSSHLGRPMPSLCNDYVSSSEWQTPSLLMDWPAHQPPPSSAMGSHEVSTSHLLHPAVSSPRPVQPPLAHSGPMSHPACGVSAHEFSGYNQFCNHPSSLIPRPKLTTTLWEDEGTVCYQVDANGICVARRQDNDMINGTKLLNVTGMSRGKRDGILKNERGRVVVKVGAMHLKGVWITFSRAKALATQFKIHDILYPLFVDDLTMFVYSSSLQQGPLPPRSAPLLASHGEETYNHSTGMGGAPPADHSPMMASDFSGHYAKQTSECLYPRQLPARLHPVPADIHDGPLSPTSPTSPNGCQQPWNQRRNSLVMRASAPNGFHDPSSRHHPYSQSVYAPPTKEGVRPNFPRVSSTGYCHNGQPASFSS